MKWNSVLLSTAVVLSLGVPRAGADPVVLSAGNAAELSYAVQGSAIDLSLGNVSTSAALLLEFTGLLRNSNYRVQAWLTNTSNLAWSAMDAEVLNPKDPAADARDAPSAGDTPPGYSHSNDHDGFSFAQRANLERRSDVFADVFADERTNRRDFLRYSGGMVPSGAQVLLTFGLRDYDGNRPFLLSLTPAVAGAATPEPATLLLIGTGGLGVIRAIRQRRRVRS